jgi:predicted nuclease of predicted toxin-antitoxin system
VPFYTYLKKFNFKKGGKIMKITRNGKTVIIANGRVIRGGWHSGKAKKINEIKHIGAEGIRQIKVDSDMADVIIVAGNRAEIEAHYYGEVCTDNKIKFDVTTRGDEISVSAKINGNTFVSSLKLNLFIPKKLYKFISVKCKNGDVELCRNVGAELLKINSQNGNIKTEATFNEITTASMNGSIDISINAKSDVEIFANSMNGNVNVVLNDIDLCNISISSMNGSAINRYNSTGKYKATGDISSMNGNVRVVNS